MKIKELTIGDASIGIYQFDIIDERMYVIKSGNEVVIIDPYKEESLLEDLPIDCKMTILITHEHFDHFSGVNFYKDSFNNCTVMCGSKCAKILKKEDNGTSRFPFLFIGDREMFNRVRKEFEFPYRPCIDSTVEEGDAVQIADSEIRVLYTPGHSRGGVSYLLDGVALFSGDNLLGNGQEIRSIDTDIALFLESLDKYEKLLGSGVLVFPGHGEVCELDDIVKTVRSYV